MQVRSLPTWLRAYTQSIDRSARHSQLFVFSPAAFRFLPICRSATILLRARPLLPPPDGVHIGYCPSLIDLIINCNFRCYDAESHKCSAEKRKKNERSTHSITKRCFKQLFFVASTSSVENQRQESEPGQDDDHNSNDNHEVNEQPVVIFFF